VLGIPDGYRFVVIASNFGKQQHPAWHHDLRGHQARPGRGECGSSMTSKKTDPATAHRRRGEGHVAELLDYLRAAIAATVEGVPDPQVRTAGVPSGTSLLGLIKHLACVERFYFLGEDVADWNATLRPAPDEAPEGVLAE
jgi:hypothetical protein